MILHRPLHCSNRRATIFPPSLLGFSGGITAARRIMSAFPFVVFGGILPASWMRSFGNVAADHWAWRFGGAGLTQCVDRLVACLFSKIEAPVSIIRSGLLLGSLQRDAAQ